MTPDSAGEPWPFVSIVAWPEGYGREDGVRLLAPVTGQDMPTLRLRLGRQPPMVLEQVEPATGQAMIAALVAAGGDGFTFTLEDLEALGPTLALADLRVTEGALALELREGLATPVTLDRVQVLVRAHLSGTVTTGHDPLRLSSRMRTRTWDSIMAEIESSAIKDVKTTDVLDLHAVDGTVYQIDGDRFGFKALGDLRGHSDKANMDAMCELLSHLCPQAVVDEYFTLWRPPPGYRRLRLSGTGAHPQDPAFAFYSRWAALTYRHVLGA